MTYFRMRLDDSRPDGRPHQPATPEERAQRVREFQNLTQAEWHRLFVLIKAIVPPQYCDPEDALQYGLLIALRKYNGEGPLHSYVCKCAWLYALELAKKRRREVQFTDLKSEGELEDYLDSVAPYLEDPRYIEAVDELFVRRIEAILAGMYNWRFRYSTHEALGGAARMLALLRDNANLGKGTGVDEYEDTPPVKRKRNGFPTHNTLVVRKLLIDHLAHEMQSDERDVYSALKALRLSTLQAIHEGWLPI